MQVRLKPGSKSIAAVAAALAVAATPSALLAGGAPATADWRTYEGGNAALSWSPLDQINRKTIRQLEVAWQYDMPGSYSLSSPLVIDGIMYLVGADESIVALDAETGKQRWVYPKAISGRARGLTYWQSKDGKDRRIFHFVDQTMMAIDARTGQTIRSFGADGKVDLRLGFGRPVEQVARIQPGTPGRIFGNLIIIGSITGEEYGSPPGDIRAFNVITGKLAWTFHTIPHPGEFGYKEWKPDLYKTASSANNWGGMALDDKRGIVYVPLGSASYDFYGVDRPGSNLFANSLVALDARTGKRLWHFQTVHHDLWDYDLTTTPVLMTLKHNGKPVDVVVQAAKTGFLFVFDRVTGKPLWPIQERPTPKSTVPDEVTSPTQPFPTVVPPFARQRFTADDIDPRLPPAEYAEVRARVLAARNEGLFTPPGIDRETVQMPGNHGGANWGLAGAEPNSGRYYVASFDLPSILKLELTAGQPQTVGMSPLAAGEALYKVNCQICHGAERQGGAGIPELKGVGQRYSPPQIKTIVAEGRATMPAFGGIIKGDDLDKVVAFLTGLAPPGRRGGPPAGAPSPEAALSPEAAGAPEAGAAAAAPSEYVPLRYHSPYGFLMTSLGTPGNKPPWSSLTAYDLTVPKILWTRPIGSIPSYGPEPVGTAQSKGGILITAGGLIFSESNSDRKIHAWDKDTGELIWEGALPSAGQGRPITYMIKGRQYLAAPAAAGQPARPGQPDGGLPPGHNAFVVYALKK